MLMVWTFCAKPALAQKDHPAHRVKLFVGRGQHGLVVDGRVESDAQAAGGKALARALGRVAVGADAYVGHAAS